MRDRETICLSLLTNVIKEREMELTLEQKTAVTLFQTRGFLILQGGPGTGKTTTIKTMISKMMRTERILLCAFTGSATERMSKVTGMRASTIMNVLNNTDLKKRYRNATVIVDEASMVSIQLARQLMQELRPKRVLLVGDERQIPCKDGYSILTTLLQVPELPVVRLSRNHRQTEASALARTIDRLSRWNGGEDGTKAFVPEVDDQFQVIQCQTMNEAFHNAVRLYRQHEEVGAQILALTNPICDALNAATKRLPEEGGDKFEVAPGISVGDRIVCTENLYDRKERILLVANGVIGKVTGIHTIVYDNDFIDDKTRKKAFRSKFVTARAMTVHKSQGNEFADTGIILLGGFNSPQLELLYTALSRFKGRAYLIGTRMELSRTFRSRFNPSVDMEVIRDFAKRKTPPEDGARKKPDGGR